MPVANPAPITVIRRQELTPDECRRLYSAEGLTDNFRRTANPLHGTLHRIAGHRAGEVDRTYCEA